MRVLVISHSQDLAQAISPILKIRWPDLSLAQGSEAKESLALIHREQPDIVIFHVLERSEERVPSEAEGAPRLDSFDLISRIRSFSDVPLIVISQSDDVMDRVKALETGADDWVPLAFGPMEFIAKVNAILRRRSSEAHNVASFFNGKLSVNYDAREVWISGRSVKLTPIQYRLLCHLVKNQGRVCSTAELLQRVWGPNYNDDRELLKLSIYRLRSRIEEDPSKPEIILNERGIGYIIRATGSRG